MTEIDKYRIHVFKQQNSDSHGQFYKLFFSVMDCSKFNGSNFPCGWLCNLPQNKSTIIGVNPKNQHSFSMFFGESSHHVAINLLTQAKETYANEMEIVKEIDKRLKLLLPKEKPKIRCVDCGKEIEKINYNQKRCSDCTKKNNEEWSKKHPQNAVIHESKPRINPYGVKEKGFVPKYIRKNPEIQRMFS